MAGHMNLLYTILLFTITESVLSVPLSASLSDARGPYFTTIHGPKEVEAGVPTDFTCSADCTPTCTYTWQVSGHEVKGNVMTLTVSGQTERLKLECIAINPVSKESQKTWETVTVNNQVQVKPTSDSNPQKGKAFKLTCQGIGPDLTTVWHKDGRPVPADTQMSFGKNNMTLAFSSLLPSHGGYYECVVTHGAIKVTSRGYLLSFGTIAVSIEGPDTAEAGVQHNFTCLANCTGLDCSISWVFSHGFPQGSFSARGTKIQWTPARPGMVQVFQCVAENSLAQRTAQDTKTVTVPALPPTTPPPKPSGSVMEKPSVAVVLLGCLQLLFVLSA